jgi:hypothetical protein
MSEETKAPEATAEAQATAQEPVELTVQDLQSLKTIIDVASQRGAFKPNEMMSVGQVYNKLDVFLNAVAAQQNQQPQG